MSIDPKNDFDVMEKRLELFCAAIGLHNVLEDRVTSAKTTQVDKVETFYEKVTKEKTPFGTRVITTKRECLLDGKEFFSLIKIDEPTKDGQKITSKTRTLCGSVETIQTSYGFEPEPEPQAGCCIN